MEPKQIVYYHTRGGGIPFKKWLQNLRDRSVAARVMTQVDRAVEGNLGDFKTIGMGVLEMRIHWGPGYRIYFGFDGIHYVVLLLGGNKSRQQQDIRKAQEYWQDYLRRKNEK